MREVEPDGLDKFKRGTVIMSVKERLRPTRTFMDAVKEDKRVVGLECGGYR